MEQLNFALEQDELSDRLGGGMAAGSLVVIEGAHGTGKSVLTQRLVNGFVQNGHTASLVSTELTTSGFMHQMSSLRYPVERPMLEERLVFIPVYPLLAARAPRHDLLRRIITAKRMYSKEIIVFDSFSKFLADHDRALGAGYKSMEQAEAVHYFFKRLTSMGKTIILTIEAGQVREQMTNLFRDSADTYLTLRFELLGSVASRRIIVNRMSRAATRVGDVIGYRVEPGLGVVTEIRSVV